MNIKNILHLGIQGFSLIDNGVHVDIANSISHALVGSLTNDTIVAKTHKGYLSADGIFLILGASGTGKTLPMREAKNISESLRVAIPQDFTKESLIDYFALMEDDEYLHPNNGILFWDEMSSKFTESKNKKFKSGVIELISMIYDHELEVKYVKSDGKIIYPQKPYVSLVGMSVPQSIQYFPDLFFSQGICGRANWHYTKVDDVKEPDSNWNDFENKNKSEEMLKKFSKELRKLQSIVSKTRKRIIFTLDDDANKIIRGFEKHVHNEWKSLGMNDPSGWDWAYLKRLPEMATKHALRNAIGKELTKKTPFKGECTIGKDDMLQGRLQALKNQHCIEDLILIKKGLSTKVGAHSPPLVRIRRAIYEAKNQRLNTTQWKRKSNTTDHNTMMKYIDHLEKAGDVKEVDKTTITNPNEIKRLLPSNRSKVYEWVSNPKHG